MASANSIGVRTSADHPGRIAPVSTLSAADRSAHDAASWLSPAGRAALQRLTVATGTDSDPDVDEALRRVRDHGAALRDGLAEYRAWAGDAA